MNRVHLRFLTVFLLASALLTVALVAALDAVRTGRIDRALASAAAAVPGLLALLVLARAVVIVERARRAR